MIDDPRTEEIHRAAARWAKSYWLPEEDFLASIRSTRVRTLSYSRLRAEGRTRWIVARFAASESPGRATDMARQEDFDPWAETRESLRAKTWQAVDCPTCFGEKRVRCMTCAGSGRIHCSGCSGVGRVFSFRSKRFVQCSSCRGRGVRGCTVCRTGSISCRECGGKGRMMRWLDIEDEPREVIVESDRNALGQAIAEIPFNAHIGRFPVSPVQVWKGPIREMPAEVRSFFDREGGRRHFDARTDRVSSVEFQSFVGEVATVYYEIGGRAASIDVKLWDYRVAADAAGEQPLRRRRKQIGLGAGAAILLGIVLAIWYGSRHSYLAQAPQMWVLVALAFLLGLTLFWPLSRLSLPRGASPWNPSWIPVLLVLLVQGSTAATGYPNSRRALFFEQQGSLAAALREAEACVDLQVDVAACGEIYDRIQLNRVLEVGEPEEAWRVVASHFYSSEARRAAEQHAVSLTLEKGLELKAHPGLAGQAALAKLLALVPKERFREEAELQNLQIHLHGRRLLDCSTNMDPACARTVLIEASRAGLEEEDLGVFRRKIEAQARAIVVALLGKIRAGGSDQERKEACKETPLKLDFLDAVSQQRRLNQMLRGEVTAACTALENEMRLKLTNQLKQSASTRISPGWSAASSSWATAPLRCRDGSLSPSCVCGQASRRGCCSHHGGVAGCSQ